MRTFEELQQMSQEEIDRANAIAQEGYKIRKQYGIDPYPELPEELIAEGDRILGVNLELLYDNYGSFRAMNYRKIAQACGIPDSFGVDGVSYNMQWLDAFGEEGLRFICSIPLLIAP